MNLHDFDKATQMRQMITILDRKIVTIRATKEIHLIKENKSFNKVKDLARDIVEVECCEDIKKAQHAFCDHLEKSLTRYKCRLEKQFEKI